MSEASFLEAELESVRFHGCDLTRADFRGARLRRCEFRRSNLTDLEGVQGLKGAAIDWPRASLRWQTCGRPPWESVSCATQTENRVASIASGRCVVIWFLVSAVGAGTGALDDGAPTLPEGWRPAPASSMPLACQAGTASRTSRRRPAALDRQDLRRLLQDDSKHSAPSMSAQKRSASSRTTKSNCPERERFPRFSNRRKADASGQSSPEDVSCLRGRLRREPGASSVGWRSVAGASLVSDRGPRQGTGPWRGLAAGRGFIAGACLPARVR